MFNKKMALYKIKSNKKAYIIVTPKNEVCSDYLVFIPDDDVIYPITNPLEFIYDKGAPIPIQDIEESDKCKLFNLMSSIIRVNENISKNM